MRLGNKLTTDACTVLHGSPCRSLFVVSARVLLINSLQDYGKTYGGKVIPKLEL